jgi:hypothetical protein
MKTRLAVLVICLSNVDVGLAANKCTEWPGTEAKPTNPPATLRAFFLNEHQTVDVLNGLVATYARVCTFPGRSYNIKVHAKITDSYTLVKNVVAGSCVDVNASNIWLSTNCEGVEGGQAVCGTHEYNYWKKCEKDKEKHIYQLPPTWYSDGYYAVYPRPLQHQFLSGVARAPLHPAGARDFILSSPVVVTLKVCPSGQRLPFTLIGSLDPEGKTRDTAVEFTDSTCRLVQGRGIYSEGVGNTFERFGFTYSLAGSEHNKPLD